MAKKAKAPAYTPKIVCKCCDETLDHGTGASYTYDAVEGQHENLADCLINLKDKINRLETNLGYDVQQVERRLNDHNL